MIESQPSLPDLVQVLKDAALDTKIRAIAEDRFQDLAWGGLFGEHTRDGIRVSDSGKCVREVWADIHDKLDIPEDADVQITRFDIGTIYGAWIACLLKAALEEMTPQWEVHLEPEVLFDGVPGHIDMDVRNRFTDRSDWVIEIKSTYWSRALDDPSHNKKYQVVQAASYAAARQAPSFSLLTIGPAVVGSSRFRQDNYITTMWAGHARVEMARLAYALRDEEPAPDVKEPWRCKSCRYSACAKNKNPNQVPF